LVGLAVAAGKIGTDLCTNPDTIADFDILDLASNLDERSQRMPSQITVFLQNKP